jgi:GT2 family glycosyltransferase
VREVFEDGRDIVLCEPDGAGLAAAIERLADDDELRARVGAGAHALMRERFGDGARGRVWGGLLGGGEATAAGGAATARVGVAILNFNGAQDTARCLASLTTCEHGDLRVLVVDNGSAEADRRVLEAAVASHAGVELVVVDENLGYAGGNNLAIRRLFAGGCDYVLVLNNDTLVTPEAIPALVRCARAHPQAGPIGPRISRDWPGARPASLGERFWAPLAWLPRTLLRHRRPRQRSYPVPGVLGCALLLSRTFYERVGTFDEDYFAYYEEVDLCLRAGRAGMRPRVEPGAEIAHVGHRGFGSGLSRVAAYLKARNLWRMGARRVGAAGWLLFAPGYLCMIVASMATYLLRGQPAVVRAMAAGVAAGIDGRDGRPPQSLFDGDGGVSAVGAAASSGSGP